MPVGILLQFLNLLVHLLEHLHEYFSTDLYFFHGVYSLADIVTFVVAKESTSMANHFTTSKTDEFFRFVMCNADLSDDLCGLDFWWLAYFRALK